MGDLGRFCVFWLGHSAGADRLHKEKRKAEEQEKEKEKEKD